MTFKEILVKSFFDVAFVLISRYAGCGGVACEPYEKETGMFVLNLKEATEQDSSRAPLGALLEEMKRLEKQKVKIYYTYCYTNFIFYSFATTTKDVHLALGTLAGTPLENLCVVLEGHLWRPGVDGEILLLKDEESGKGLLITLRDSGTVFADSSSPSHTSP